MAHQHSPGPWKIQSLWPYGIFSEAEGLDEDSWPCRYIARTDDGGEFIEDQYELTQKANACVISAAPDMLDALKEILNCIRAASYQGSGGSSSPKRIASIAEDAIAKAERGNWW